MQKHNIKDLFRNFNINKATALYKTHVLSLLMLAGTAFGAGACGFIEFANKDVSDDLKLRGHIVEGGFVVGIVALIAVFMSEVNKKLDKAAANTALKYLKQLFVNQPELKKFESVLSNPKALDKVAAYVFNNLRPSEQQEIHNILEESYLVAHMINQYLKNLDPKADIMDVKRITEVENLKDRVIEIIKNHAKIHPEFRTGLETLLLGLDYEIYRDELAEQNRANINVKHI